MKMLLIAATFALGTAGAAQGQDQMQTQTQGQAQTQGDPNGPGVPPGDEITAQGTNPEGQPYTPPGFNQNMAVYPPASAAPGNQPGMQEYPRCTREVKDRCVQMYARRPQ